MRFCSTILKEHKFSTIVMRNSATQWTCTKLCCPAMGHRRTLWNKRLFLQGSSLSSLLMPTFITIPVQTHCTWYIWMHGQCSPCSGTPETLNSCQEKQEERASIRIHFVRVTDSHRAAPSFEVESLDFYLLSYFTDISSDRFATPDRQKSADSWPPWCQWVLLLVFIEARFHSIFVLD